MILFSSFNHTWVLLLFMFLGLSSGIIFFVGSFLIEKLKIINLKSKPIKKINEDKLDNAKENNNSLSDENVLSENLNDKTLINESENISNKNTTGNQPFKNKKTKNKFKSLKGVFAQLIIKRDETKLKEKNLKNNNDKKDKKNLINKNTKHTKHIKNKKDKKEKKHKKNILENIYIKRIIKFLYKSKKFIVSLILNSLKILLILLVIVASYLINLHYNLGYLRVSFVLLWLAFFFIAKSFCKILANLILNFYNSLRRKKLNIK